MTKSKWVKKILNIFLISMLIFTYTIPANAEVIGSETKTKTKIAYTDKNGNQVVEVTNNNETGYVVVSKGVKYNDLSDETKLNDLAEKTKSKKVIGERWYLAFSENLDNAIEMAKIAPPEPTKQTDNKYSIQATYFWHSSYVESYWNTSDSFSKHVHLTPIDATYITNVGWISADTLAGALIATGVVTLGTGLVIGGIVTLAIISYAQFASNSDGSFDIYSPNSYRVDNTSVSPGQYLGYARAGTGWWNYYYWPSYAPGYN